MEITHVQIMKENHEFAKEKNLISFIELNQTYFSPKFSIMYQHCYTNIRRMNA